MADLAAFLTRAYEHSWQGTPDPAAECAAAIPRAEIEAKLGEMRPAMPRCHITRMQVKFLERVLAVPPAAK